MSRASDRSALAIYVGRIRDFDRTDWLVYLGWVGMMLGLVFGTGGFVLAGRAHGVAWPAEAYLVPIGAAGFAIAIAIDTIGHRTIYKQALRGGEQLVHQHHDRVRRLRAACCSCSHTSTPAAGSPRWCSR